MTENITPPVYATFNARLLASSIDVGLILIVAVPFVEWVMQYLFAPIDPTALTSALSVPGAMQSPDKLITELWYNIRQQHVLERAVAGNLLQIICIALYTLPWWFRYSTTPGKMLLGLEIRDAVTGARITREQAVTRFLGYIISAIPLTLGFVWMLCNKKRQGVHDMIAGTVVVRKPRLPKA